MNIRGGIARRSGVTFISDCFIVTATREKNGDIRVDAKETLEERGSNFNKLYRTMPKIPFIRGIWSLFSTFLESRKLLLIMFLVVLVVALINAFIFKENVTGRMHFSLWLLIPFLFILLLKGTSWGKYHAAEHQVANTYEQGKRVSLDNVKLASRVHRYCGTNLVILAAVITLIMVVLLSVNVLLAGLIGISFGTEIHLNQNKKIEKLLFPFHRFGALLQFCAFTSKAGEEHLEVAMASLNELIRIDQRKSHL